MSTWTFLAAAILLGLERMTYVWIARAPGGFRRWCARPAIARLGEPVDVVRRLFYGFKAVQLSVFAGWCYVHGDGSLLPAGPPAVAVGIAAAAVVAGQILNWSVFYRLGPVGAFFGDRLGHDMPRCEAFPYSLLSHPQYVGTVLTIWGFFLVMRFPRDDWYLLPALETVYYAGSAYLEDAARESRSPESTSYRRGRKHR